MTPKQLANRQRVVDMIGDSTPQQCIEDIYITLLLASNTDEARKEVIALSLDIARGAIFKFYSGDLNLTPTPKDKQA